MLLIASIIIFAALILNLRKQLNKHVITPVEQLTKKTNALTIGDFSNLDFTSSIPTAFAELDKLLVDFQFMMNSGQFKLNMKNFDIVFLSKDIAESIEVYANQKNIELSFKSNIESKNIIMDEEKFERILLNILSNAMKFTDSGGKIAVTVDENKSLDVIQIRVTDTGIGIPKDKQEIIFERFGQVDNNLSRQAEGSGIGLSLVKLLVKILEGTIEVESKVGVGSMFTITLPIKKEDVDENTEYCLDTQNELVSKIKVEFSDIYL